MWSRAILDRVFRKTQKTRGGRALRNPLVYKGEGIAGSYIFRCERWRYWATRPSVPRWKGESRVVRQRNRRTRSNRDPPRVHRMGEPTRPGLAELGSKTRQEASRGMG